MVDPRIGGSYHPRLAAPPLAPIPALLRDRVLDEYALRLTLEAQDHLSVRDYLDTIRDAHTLLREIERSITGENKAGWAWQEPDASVDLVASVNGVSAESLDRIVAAAQEGFVQAQQYALGQSVDEWPADFPQKARAAAQRILGRLDRLEAIAVEATNHERVEIRTARIGRIVKGKARARTFATVEGVLYMIAGSERTVRAGLREAGTNAYVRIALDTERWQESVPSFWNRRVIVEGRVAYAESGRPLSILDVTRIAVRSGRPLSEFEGVAPGLTGDLSAEEFIAILRGDD